MSDGYVDEIFEQPRILTALAGAFQQDYQSELAQVRHLLASRAIDKIVLTGMGGSLYSLYPAFLKLSRQAGIPATLWDSSELVQQAPDLINDRTLLIAVSQSGESAELVRLCQSSQRPRVSIAVTNSGRSTLADWADVAIRTNAGPERTASTKTYTAGLAALALVACTLLAGDIAAQTAAIEAAATAINDNLRSWQALGADIVRFLGYDRPIAMIGRGANFATAAMASLLTAEASKLACAAYAGGQFRHGPLELVREGFGCVIFASGTPGPAELDHRLADTILDLGGRCAWVAAGSSVLPARDKQFLVDLPGCGAECEPLLNIVPVQLMQVPLAIARGFVPAQFLNASKVTTVE